MNFQPGQFIHGKSSMGDYPFHMNTRNYPTQIRNNPHPFNVRSVKGFLGLPTRIVETEDSDAMEARRTVEQYVKDSFKRGDWNYSKNSKSYVKKSKDLDSILALQYFTGLQSYSFKEDYLPYLGYREYLTDWRRQLRNLTETAYQPYMDQTKPIDDVPAEPQHPNEWINGPQSMSRAKTMYSETGRLITREGMTNTSSSQRLRSRTSVPTRQETNQPNLDALDAVVFVLLGELLQTQSVHQIQSWLSRSSERERALITTMLQAAISKPTTVFETDAPIRRAQTSEVSGRATQSAVEIKNKNNPIKMEKSDILIIETRESDGKTNEEIRPPTSSVFRPQRVQNECTNRSDSPTKHCGSGRDISTSVWIPQNSIKK